jgi:glycosyltransferase involved in cell wall biosynthesis
MLRFERFGRVASRWGCEVCYIAFADMPRSFFRTQFDVLSITAAERRSWDMTMVPGAGFPYGTISRMRLLQNPVFGMRVQHILNSPAMAQKFFSVNRSFNPHVVIFNNRHWSRTAQNALSAGGFAVVEGAVDAGTLAPGRRSLSREGSVIIGGLANKNPGPLLAAVRQMPARYVLRLFGDPREARSLGGDLLACGRLELVGLLDEEELSSYYSGLDCVVHTEAFAGWSNLAAEALACGVPLICTPHGTGAFAEHEKTALVVEPHAEAIKSALERLCADRILAQALVRLGREKIESFTWERYARELLAACDGFGWTGGCPECKH